MQGTRNANVAVDGRDLLAQPLTARSVIASLLLGMHPPRMPARRLVQWCGLFGIAPGTARTALSRMADRGELVAGDATYELAGRVRSRQAAQDWSLRPEPHNWDGEWSLAFVAGEARPPDERAALRAAMRRCRYAELREGCWARPDNLPRASAPADAWDVVDAQCRWWLGQPENASRALAEELFEARAWSDRAQLLLRRATRVTAALDAGDHARLHEGFVVGAAVLQHVRNDPLLPAELLPARWPGPELRDAYRTYERAFAGTVTDWFRTTEQ